MVLLNIKNLGIVWSSNKAENSYPWGKSPEYTLNRGWVDPRSGVDVLGKRRIPDQPFPSLVTILTMVSLIL
jgi:hypothetical protein